VTVKLFAWGCISNRSQTFPNSSDTSDADVEEEEQEQEQEQEEEDEEEEEEEDFAHTEVRCVRAHPLWGALTRRGLNPINLVYSPSRLH